MCREEEEHQGEARAAQGAEEGPCGCDRSSCQEAHTRGAGGGWCQTRTSCTGLSLTSLRALTLWEPAWRVCPVQGKAHMPKLRPLNKESPAKEHGRGL